jgi:dolichol-phosphate mannosyltransferase
MQNDVVDDQDMSSEPLSAPAADRVQPATAPADPVIERAAAAVELPKPWCDSAVTVVLPTYNEADNLPIVTKALFALPLPQLRVLVVDDNSPDGTGELADRLATGGGGRLSVVHRTAKEGLGRAYVDGMTRALDAGADFVVQMDADLSHPPEALPEMLGTLLATRAGVVIGSRYVTGGVLAEEWGVHRRLLSAWANFYVQRLLSLRIRDVTAGFKLWRAGTLRDLRLESIGSNGYSFQVEMNYRAVLRGHKVVEVPIRFDERARGASKMSFAVQLESALVPLRLRRQRRTFDR